MRRFKYWLLSFYPRAWRERYEEEFAALLEEYNPSFYDFLNIFFYALREQSFTLFHKGKAMLYQQRTDFSILDCFNGFCVGLIMLPIAGAFLSTLGGVLGTSLARPQVQP